MKKEERQNMANAVLAALGFIVGFMGGDLITHNWSLNEYFYARQNDINEVYVALERYSNPPCTTPSHCVVNVWSY